MFCNCLYIHGKLQFIRLVRFMLLDSVNKQQNPDDNDQNSVPGSFIKHFTSINKSSVMVTDREE